MDTVNYDVRRSIFAVFSGMTINDNDTDSSVDLGHTGVCWLAHAAGGNRKNSEAASQEPSHDADPQDVLVEDPVCHVLLPKHQALRLRRDGVTYYFCSEHCCDQFVEQTEKEKNQGEQ